MTQPGDERELARGFLGRLIEGTAPPRDVYNEARTAWLSGEWPGPNGAGYDPIAHEVLFLLADARELGVSHEDAAALLAYLDGADGDIAASQERLYEHVMSVDAAEREALQQSDKYYGASLPEGADQGLEMAFSNPEHRRLHKGVRLDPESVWPDVRGLLCDPADAFDHLKVGLVEVLIYDHADAFIGRLEALVEECESAAVTVAMASVGGVAGPGIDRFDALQQRLLDKLAPNGTFETPRDIEDPD